ncbi:phosphotransferase [Streptomyces sp. TRM 70351]|uniref:phosphotransferase n=1 Tax=Streptomyces sp. TRM 70351 TaxID=3116552 RepID=UPI003FCDC843
MRRYGAGEPVACEPLAHGLLNRGYRVTTPKGVFFLKHHLDGDPVALDRRHRATALLGALGIPAVPPVCDADGRSVAVLRGRCYALHPWVTGRHREGAELTPADCRRLGALLGRVHEALRAVLPLAEAERDAGHPSADPAATEALIEELLTRIRARHRARDTFDLLAEHRLRERRALLREHAQCRPAAGSEPAVGWVHGDFHPLNVLYGQQAAVEPIAIVDWDRLGVQPRAEEVVRAGVIFFVRPDGTLELSKVNAYARGYRRAAGAGAAELAAAVYRVWWERLNDFWMLRWHYQLRDRRTDQQFPAAAALVRWWTNGYDRVRDAFCG